MGEVEIRKDVTIFATSPIDEETKQLARDYIKRFGLSAEDVKLVSRQDDDQVLVITKRNLILKEPQDDQS